MDATNEQVKVLQARIAELEREKQMMKESVFAFREELGKSVMAARHANSPTVPLEILLEYEARSQLRESR